MTQGIVRKVDLGQTISILANLGVIGGIVLLAFELDQNNSLLRAQASYGLLLNRTQVRRSVVGAPSEVLDFWVRVSSNAPLTAADELRLTSFVEGVFLNWQFEYGQFVDGNLPEDELPIEGFRATYRGKGFAGIKIFPEVWQSLQHELRPDFVQWMEETVIGP